MTEFSDSIVTDDGWEEEFSKRYEYSSSDVARVYREALIDGGFRGEVEIDDSSDHATVVRAIHVPAKKRKVLISPGFGSGFSYGIEKRKQLAEDPALIELVEKGRHCSGGKVSRAFRDRLKEIDPENGGYISSRSIESLKVIEVEGPYQICEHDGNEWIVERDKFEWW